VEIAGVLVVAGLLDPSAEKSSEGGDGRAAAMQLGGAEARGRASLGGTLRRL
jgi:hypothetical protein